jgi:hypothetical protein
MTRIARTLVLAFALVLALGASAAASFTASSSSAKGYAGAQALTTGVTPTATVSGRNVTISWTDPGGSVPVTGYTVKRYNTTGTVQTLKTACTGTITGLSCTENAVPAGSWRYSVTPIVGTNWKGTESAQSTAVTVGAAAVALTPTTVSSMPQTLTGTISNYVSGQTVTLRLDTTTGTVLSGSITPSTVPTSGTATVSVTLPAGTTNGSHKIYPVGSAGDVPFATITVAVPRTVTTTAWDVRDASSGTEVNVTDPLATAGDGLTATTTAYGASFAANRYDDGNFNGPLRPGIAATSVSFNLRIAAPSAGQTACFYVEIRAESDPATLLETEGSAAAPTCVTGTTQTTTTMVLTTVTSTDIANDLTARVFGRVSGGGSFVVDQATITGTTADGAFTLYEDGASGMVSGSPYSAPWSLFAQDSLGITGGTAYTTAYATTRYVKYTFPVNYVPTAATGISATIVHAYRGSTAGICTYMQIYSNTTSVATKGSSTSNLSCATSTTTDQLDTVSVPEVNTVTEGNTVVVKVYAKSSGATTALISDRVQLQLTYVKTGDAP